jgi:hypothetical protein
VTLTPAQFNRKLFWSMIVFGVVSMGVGATLTWLDHAATQESEQRRRLGRRRSAFVRSRNTPGRAEYRRRL